MTDTLFQWFCRIGWHGNFARSERWVPSMHAPIVEEFHQTIRCGYCRKLISQWHWYWNNGDDYGSTVPKDVRPDGKKEI